jgi:atypical dual specificity phosphatase
MSYEVVQAIQERAHQDQAFRLQLYEDPLAALNGYDLTEEEKYHLVLPNFRWLIEHRIAGVSFPRSEAALMLLREKGIRALLSLSENSPAPELLTRFGLQVKHLPVADFTAPTILHVEQAIAAINSFLEENLPVAVHCGAGLGRTGTVLACYLVWQGVSAQDAIERVRTGQPGSVETPEQVAVVGLYARQLRKV